MPFFGTPQIVPCPSCGKVISIQATSCPQCARPIEPGELEASAAKNNRVAVWVAVFVVVPVILYCVWFVFAGPSRYNPTGSQAQTVYTPPPPPPLELIASRGTRSDNYLTVEGQVRNASGEKLESVWVVVETYDSAGQFVTSEDGVIDYTPLLPGQTSPFKVMVRNNPAIRRFQVSFKRLFGGAIPHADLTNPPATSTPKKKNR